MENIRERTGGKFNWIKNTVQLNLVAYSLFFVIFEFLIRALREKCPNTEFFLVRIFPEYLSVFSPNAGKYGSEHLSVFSPNAEKYGPEKTPYLDTFHAVV